MRYADAQPYQAPLHHGVLALRLQGLEATSADFAWAGMSIILPGGGAEMDSGRLGKIYIVLAGQVCVTLGDGERTLLGPFDSCYIAPGEARAVSNETNFVASMIVVMPPPASSP